MSKLPQIDLLKIPVLAWVVALLWLPVSAQTWTDEGFEAFSKGSFEASGQNLYVDRKGRIGTIRRFDLNQDGYIDLLFNNTHDDDVAVDATLATVSSGRVINHGRLPVPGSIAAVVADLNKDGFLDLVFCPNQSAIQSARGMITIMWGGEDGWTRLRQNGILPVNGAASIALADLNGDTWLDIAVLNSTAWLPNQPSGEIVRIFHGSASGYVLSRFEDIGIAGAVRLSSDDLDGDGLSDLLVLTANSVEIIWANPSTASGPQPASRTTTSFKIDGVGLRSSATGDLDGDKRTDIVVGTADDSIILIRQEPNRRFTESSRVKGIKASAISLGDVDGDNSLDIVASKFEMRKAGGGEFIGGAKLENDRVTVLWGNAGAFSLDRVSDLDAPYTVATAIADLDRDGVQDIVCATHQGESFYATESTIFWGKRHREFEKGSEGIPGEGANHVLVVPQQGAKDRQVIISNSRTGTLNEAVPLSLYYGGKDGFSVQNRLEIPFRSGYQSSAADLNGDGYVDLVAVNSAHARLQGDPYAGVNIFWGTKHGYDVQDKRTVLTESQASTTNIADLNKDGFLDIIVGFFDSPKGSSTNLVIYYGSMHGYETENRRALPSAGRSGSPNVADYNNDGWLDIAVTSYNSDVVRIFYGRAEGFEERSQEKLDAPAPIDLETADLNQDGFADLIVPTYKDRVNNYHGTGVLIFWGSRDGFKSWNSQRLPTVTSLGPTVADFDKDGHLDLFLPAYLGDTNRENLPMYLYWGSEKGFNDHDRTVFIGDSGADAVAADFNNDGLVDLAIAEHATNKGHRGARSRVYYNDGQRFGSPTKRVEVLLAMGTHWIWNYDVGHILTRSYEQTYTSQVFELDKDPSSRGEIRVDAEIRRRARLRIQVRSGSDAADLTSSEWRNVENNKFSLAAIDRSIQYRLILQSSNGDDYPVVRKVSMAVGRK